MGVRSEANVGQCASVMPSGTVTYYYDNPKNTSNFILTTEYLPVSKIIQAVQVNGYNIGSPFPTVSSTTSSSTSASPSPTLQPSIASQTASSSPPSSTASAVNNSTGLGTGPIVGIAVAATLVVLGAIAALAFIWYRRRQRAKQQYLTTLTAPLQNGKPMYEASADSAAKPEMEGQNAYQVLGSGLPPQELYGSYVR